ncbi:MAG: hypothetical protein GX366_03595 [Epulopiscium sp.]|nr:hypothetical protein [Candidatus Epulonipiscium sp.]
MEVLESIVSYVEYRKDNNYICQNQQEAIGMLHNYCTSIDRPTDLKEVDWTFFDKFLIYWLPKNQKDLSEKEFQQVLNVVLGYCDYIRNNHDIKILFTSEAENYYRRECIRIQRLKELFLQHFGYPILAVDPLVIDLEDYKKYKSRRNIKKQDGIYQQGLFQVDEIEYDNTLVLKNISKGNLVRVALVGYIVTSMREGDILHLRIKHKQFFTCWEIIDFKNCYLQNASEYLSW